MFDNKTLLNRYTAISMEMQEEYLKKPQNFAKQNMLQDEFIQLKIEILQRMENGSIRPF